MNVGVTRLDKTLVRREFWENRSLWMVPTVVLGLITLSGIIKLGMYMTGHLDAANGVHIGAGDDVVDGMDLAEADPSQVAAGVRLLAILGTVPFDIIMVFVVFFYLLDSLYADRRDRSVLFWRSMPVSDTRTVMAKLVTGMFAITAITLVATIAADLIGILFEVISGAFVKHSVVLLQHPLALLEGWALVAYALLAQAIWYLPFFGWWMLASAWAKKAPFLWAMLPPALLMFFEWLLFRTHYIKTAIFGHFVNWLTILNIDPISHGMRARDFIMQGDFAGLDDLGRYLASPELWIGTLLGVAFLYAAIWLRKNRTEI